jgi:hypothetical protein
LSTVEVACAPLTSGRCGGTYQDDGLILHLEAAGGPPAIGGAERRVVAVRGARQVAEGFHEAADESTGDVQGFRTVEARRGPIRSGPPT